MVKSKAIRPDPIVHRITAIEARLDALESPTISPLLHPTWIDTLKKHLGFKPDAA